MPSAGLAFRIDCLSVSDRDGSATDRQQITSASNSTLVGTSGELKSHSLSTAADPMSFVDGDDNGHSNGHCVLQKRKAFEEGGNEPKRLKDYS